MKSIHKKMVHDEQMRPVAVQVDYADWLQIEKLLREQPQPVAAPNAGNNVDFAALAEAVKGCWAHGDGLAYQRRIRAEWHEKGEKN
jgi:hypothetical protein